MTRAAIDLQSLRLAAGGHKSTEDGVCLLEAVAWFAGEPHTDHPKCVSPVLAAFGRRLNDVLPYDRRQELKNLIPLLPGTAGDGKDPVRRYMAVNWAVRVAAPRWLDRAGRADEAARLRALAPVVSPETLAACRKATAPLRGRWWEIRAELRSKVYEAVYAAVRENVVVADAVVAADVAADAVAADAAVADAVAAAVAAADVAADAAAAVAADVAAAAAAADVAAVADVVAADAAADDVRKAVAQALERVWGNILDLHRTEAIQLFRDMVAP